MSLRSLYFLFLLPVFFVLHGFTEHFPLIQVGDAFVLTGIYLLAVLVITGLSWLFYRNLVKAALLAFCVMGFNFFFGSVQDFLRLHFGGSLISRYSFILPVSGIIFIGIILFLRGRKKDLKVLVLFLNLALVLFIIIDSCILAVKAGSKNKASKNQARYEGLRCDSCAKPDIYFIILDEYAGNRALRERFDFDNSGFEERLRKKGFYIIEDSKSNYNYTPFSLASMLNMQYLDLNMKTKGPGNLAYCYQQISNSKVLAFFKAQGYEFYNYSIFDFPGNPAIKDDIFLQARAKLITGQTFLSRVWDDILFNIGTGKWKFRPVQKQIIYSHLKNNLRFSEATEDLATKKTNKPRFVYTHLMMPHYPYYFDSKGKALPIDSLYEGKQMNRKNYTEYLQYCNRKIDELSTSILDQSGSAPIIILTGDHGFRYFQDRTDRAYCFMNMSAIYLPGRKYEHFYKGMSLVNLFPTIINSEFRQNMPVQKDSTIYLWD